MNIRKYKNLKFYNYKTIITMNTIMNIIAILNIMITITDNNRAKDLKL
jgi:hypothetical protein